MISESQSELTLLEISLTGRYLDSGASAHSLSFDFGVR